MVECWGRHVALLLMVTELSAADIADYILGPVDEYVPGLGIGGVLAVVVVAVRFHLDQAMGIVSKTPLIAVAPYLD